jgi:hypothetical protein
MKATTILAAAGVVALLAGCGGSSSAHHHATAPAPSTAPAPPVPAPLTCSGLNPNLATLVADQNSQNKSLTENWVNIPDGSPTSQGNDLQNAASQWQGASASTTVSADAAQLATDAGNFSNATSGGLAPGWTAPYKAVAHDISALAHLCGLKYHNDSYYIYGHH